MGVCANHWHVGFPKVKLKSSERPCYPLSVFEGIPKSFCPQTLISLPRNIKKHKVDIDSRNSATNHNIEVEDTDMIKSWDNLIVLCQGLQFITNVNKTYLSIYYIHCLYTIYIVYIIYTLFIYNIHCLYTIYIVYIQYTLSIYYIHCLYTIYIVYIQYTLFTTKSYFHNYDC